ncbi:uncharacterized protein LOC123537066 [Mercenaria mercenaria]|uniref:uncharacterized protein LOC123537066 n=1 Tax=Mercenaria mercenaria TaxID=6596 RepID=UPI00234E8BDB|nr:uncharacterized protein LOC123537066 [Mercenaria mercenaria]
MIQTDDCAVISRLPAEWHGLMKQLGSSVDRGNLWFTEETSSKYGSQPAWHKLITALIKCDPCIEDNKLTFKPRFLLLPVKLQERLLNFLQHQSYTVPDMYIKEFVLGLAGYTDLQSSLYHQLSGLFRETKYTDDLLAKAVQKSTSKLEDTVQDKGSSSEVCIAVPGSQESVIILDESEEEEGMEPAYKRQRVEEKVDKFPEENENQTVTIETNDEESSHAHNLERKDKGKEETISAIFAGKEDMIWKIKEIWQNCISDREIEGLSEVSKLSVKEIEVFCKMVDFDNMSDDSIELVCQHLCQVSDSLSYSSAVCILTFVLGHRITQLSQNASRKLSGAVTLVAQKFPKQTVESVLVPCILQSEISPAQSEIVCKTLKDCTSASTKGYFIQKMIQNNFILNENKIPVLQTVIDSSCDLTNDVFCSLLNCLNEASLSMEKNLKFGKLLLALVNKHTKLFNQELKTKVEHILDKHKTFLKKSIQSALN